MTATPEPPTPRAAADDTATAVSSGGGASPPRRARRRTVSSVSSASTSTKPVATPTAVPAPVDDEPVEAELDDEDTGTTTRSRRRTAKAPKAPKTQRQPTARPAPVVTPDVDRMPRGERRFRHTITKVDLWTVLKLSLCFYLSTMFVTLIAFVSLYIIAEAAGVISSVEKFLGELLSANDFTFLSGEVLRGAILITLVVVALQVVLTVIAASFYNIFAELFGGLEITVREEEVTPRDR